MIGSLQFVCPGYVEHTTFSAADFQGLTPASPVVRYTIHRAWRPREAPVAIDFQLTEPASWTTGGGYLLRVLGKFENLSWEHHEPPKVQFMACYAVIAVCPLRPAEPGTYLLGCDVSLFGLPTQSQIDLILEVPGTGPVHVASISLSVEQTLPPPTRFSPLMVSALPRSGTTWLMSLLSAHPEVVVAGGYPFEQAHGVYWATMARTLTQPDLEQSGPCRLRRYDRCLPPNPFNCGTAVTPAPWFAGDYFRHMAGFVRSMADEFYAEAAADKPLARLIAEKWPGRIVPHVMRTIYREVRELYLLRSPREVILSILRFNARRGFLDFGVEEFGTGEAFIASVAQQLREDMTLFRQRTWDKSGVVLDYALLRKDPETVLSKAFKLLGMEHSPQIVRQMLRASRRLDMSAHITSDGTADDIQLSSEQEAWIARYFANYQDW